jgi:hypothetical protein
MFFFEKKNQKIFLPWCGGVGGAAPREQEESLFASFSSEKEDFLAPMWVISSRRAAA